MGSESSGKRKEARAVAFVAVAVAVVAGFAGCLGDAKDAKADASDAAVNEQAPVALAPVLAEDGRDLRTELVPRDTVGAPTWQVGEMWQIMVLLGDGEELDYTTVMAEDRGDAWFLASPDQTAAKEEAVWDLPIYGEVAKDSLALAMFGESWDWIYRFPLSDGLQWNDTVEFDNNRPVSFTASYIDAISTPVGDRPGFQVTGLTEEGETILDYDFVPELGWFAHFWAYDLRTEEPDDFEFHAMVMDHQVGWKGTYFVHEAHELVGFDSGVAVDPEDPANPWLAPAPSDGFTVSEDAAFVYGFAYAWAFGGASELLLVDPAGTTYAHTGLGAPDGFELRFYDAPAVAGEWGIVNVGAGAAAGAGLFLWELHETIGEL